MSEIEIAQAELAVAEAALDVAYRNQIEYFRDMTTIAPDVTILLEADEAAAAARAKVRALQSTDATTAPATPAPRIAASADQTPDKTKRKREAPYAN